MNTNDDLMALLDAAVTTAREASPFLPVAPGDVEARIEASKALVPTGPVHVPGMLRPFLDHQAAAYQYLLATLQTRGGAYDGDDMGLGKTQTLQALIATRLADVGGYAVVVAPAVTSKGWKDDLAASFPGLRMVHLHGRGGDIERDATGRIVLPEADIYWLSDDPLTLRAWFTDGMDARKQFVMTNLITDASIVVRDELHRDKGDNGRPRTATSRCRLMMSVGAECHARGTWIVGASGSMILNRPIEALTQLQIVGGKALVMDTAPGIRNVIGWAYRYCAPITHQYGTDWSGADKGRLPELHDLLRRYAYVRRERRQIGNLPDGNFLVQALALNGAMTRYTRLQREFLQVLFEEKGPEAMNRAARAEALQRMLHLRIEAGKAKAAAVCEHVEALLADGKQVVVMYEHTTVRDEFAKHLGKVRMAEPGMPKGRPVRVATLDGATSAAWKAEHMTAFQAGEADVMLAQVTSAGIGVTLTAASEMVWLQLPWSAGPVRPGLRPHPALRRHEPSTCGPWRGRQLPRPERSVRRRRRHHGHDPVAGPDGQGQGVRLHQQRPRRHDPRRLDRGACPAGVVRHVAPLT